MKKKNSEALFEKNFHKVQFNREFFHVPLYTGHLYVQQRITKGSVQETVYWKTRLSMARPG